MASGLITDSNEFHNRETGHIAPFDPLKKDACELHHYVTKG